MPRTWFRRGLVALLAAVAVWGYGIAGSFGINELDETCQQVHGQPYDGDYRHREWSGPPSLYPLHNMCNEHYDLVPGWINPTVAVLTLSGGGMVLFAAVQWTSAVVGRRIRATGA
jgi:hypothetical protein